MTPTNPQNPPSQNIAVKSFWFCTILLLSAFHAITIKADTTDGTTPLVLKPGTPAGSYALSDLDNINPYNGSLSFRLPLMNIGGRGTAGYTMTLPIERKWRINVTEIYLILYAEGGGPPLPDPQVTRFYFPSSNWWAGLKPGYGPGVLLGRVAQFDSQVCGDSTTRATSTLTRLTFTAPDDTEFELRDKQSDGAPAAVGICDTNGFNRGKVFVTADGTAATFISDQNIVDYIFVPNAGNDVINPSGYLLMRDGTRYRIDEGLVSWLRDRNGNKMTFGYDSFKRMTSAKDSLNREVTVTYATSSILYDEISYKGFGGAPRILRVNYAYLQDPGSLRSGYTTQTYYQLFPIAGSSTSGTYNPKVIRSVTLPNNQQYQFEYNPYGELARVVLPTGGAYEYEHAGGFGGGDANGVVTGSDGGPNVYRRVVTRRAYDDGTTMSSKTTFSGQNAISGNTNYVLMDQFGSNGTTRLQQQKIYYEGFAESSFFQLPTDYAPWKDGREFQNEIVAPDGTTVLQRVARTWQQPIAGASWPLTQPETNANAKPNNPQITQSVTTLEPAQANKVSKQIFAFDKYANQTDLYEYDFGTATPGPLVRRTRTDYVLSGYDTLNPTSSNPDLNLTSHIRNLPAQVSIFDAGGTERARSTVEYDNYVLDGPNCLQSFHCPLGARSDISGFDSSFTPGYIKRGNPTAATRYLLSNGAVTGSVSTYSHYDVAGNLVRSIDPRSTPSNIIATSIEYDDQFGGPNNEARSNTVPFELTGFKSFAFPTKITNPLGHTTYAQFDYYIGKAVNAEDANGIVASGSFSDVLDRPTQIRSGIGTNAESQTTFGYNDTTRIVTTTSDLHANNDNVLVSKVLYDQMGRKKETQQYEGGGNYIAVQTEYDALSRPYKSSNPFRPWQSQTPVWTIQAFDALGRVISVTTPDNAVVSTSYSANAVTVTDQAGKKRKSVTDALGRLIEVYEDPTGLTYQTTYVYDVLDNLVKVTQGTQQRFFLYDSLKRLLRVRHPEQSTHSSLNLADPITGNSAWSIGYQYDSSSNVTSKTDPRGVVSTYAYDVLNRNTTINYSDTTINPDITRFYDGAINGKGRFWYFYSGGDFSNGPNTDATAIDSYDALGQPLVKRQLFKLNNVWTQTYQTVRAYNRAGGVISQTYPSGRTVSYNYDSAARLADKDSQNLAFTGNLGGVQRTYSRGITYAPSGSLQQEQLGTTTPIYNKHFYNSRQQIAEILASTSGGDSSWNRGKIVNAYSLQCEGASCNDTDNNGNVRKQRMFIPHNDQVSASTSWYQQYDYDELNRLKRVHEFTGNSQLDWQQEFLYDRWGNRLIDTNLANTYGTGINNKQFEKEDATNRLYSPGDLALADNSRRIRFDQAGNQIKDIYTGYGVATFDAENRITSIQDQSGGTATYGYNADGQRTRRKKSNQETWQVYGFDGELVAEYTANGAAPNPQKEYGYRNGELLLTAEPAVGQQGTQSVSWTNAVGVSVNGNNLTKTAPDNWANGGAASSQLLSSGDGYIQVTASETNSFRMIGLSNGDANQDYTDIDFAAYLSASNYCIYEAGISRGCVSTYATGDTIRVAVESGIVKYKKNGVVVYTSSVTPVFPLRADTSFWTNGSTLNNVVISGLLIGGTPQTTQNVSWYSPVGVSVNGNSLTKIAADNWGNGGAASSQSIYSGDGYVEITASETNSFRMIGLSNGNSNQDYTDIDFAAYLSAANYCIYEAGVSRGCVSTYATGDTIRVAVESGVVKYKKNGAVVYTSSVTPVFPLLADTSFWTNGSTINNAVISGNLGGGSSAGGVRWLLADHLGTPRMIFDETGSLATARRHDYLPFGEELFASQGLRSTQLGYVSGDGVRQQFTGKERDIETGLDCFGARYYGSTQGRFTSVDPMPIKKRHLIDPRDLNRYAYVANNPLKYIDPEGLEKIIVIVRTYIPAEKVTHPPVVGATFKGDYNSKGERVSARTEHRMVIETDAKRPNSNNFENSPTVGRTERLERGVGSLTGPSEGKASGATMQAALVRINDNTVRLDVKADEANPLVLESPGITYRFNITVSSSGEASRAYVGVLGQHDGFPAYEIEVIRPDSGGTSTTVYQHNPNTTGDGPQSLYGPGEYYPEIKAVIDPKKKP